MYCYFKGHLQMMSLYSMTSWNCRIVGLKPPQTMMCLKYDQSWLTAGVIYYVLLIFIQRQLKLYKCLYLKIHFKTFLRHILWEEEFASGGMGLLGYPHFYYLFIFSYTC